MAALFEQKQHITEPQVMDVVCLFRGHFAELMVFAIQYWRKWNGIICCLSWKSCTTLKWRSVQSENPQNILGSISDRLFFMVKEYNASMPTLNVCPLLLSITWLDATCAFDLNQSPVSQHFSLLLHGGDYRSKSSSSHRAVVMVPSKLIIAVQMEGSRI